MFVDAEFLRRESLPPVLIVGSGPAGMSLALALAENRIESLVLEAGAQDFTAESQDQYTVQVIGDAYYDLDVGRLRQFGGTSNHWAGMSRALDATDFDALPSLNIPGWPISKADLDPYDARTRDILEIGETVDHALSDDIYQAGFVYSAPVNFGFKYEDTVASSDYIHVALNTPVTGLTAEDGVITAVDVVDATQTPQTLRPQIVVLACGGIENARLLLWSNENSPQLVAAPETLGRYWMEHPHEDVGEAIMQRDIRINDRERYGFYSVGVRPEVLAEHGALNTVIRISEARPPSREETIKQSICAVSPRLLDQVNALTDRQATCGRRMKAVWEQEPDRDNRVELSASDRDAYGIPRADLYWRKTELDYRTARIAFELIGQYLVSSGIAQVRALPFLLEMGNYPEFSEIGGHHHMGGTRMSASANDGVVDADLKLHGIANGYVAGSSVFVRGGHANPTFTIVQLSLRLADHLTTQLGAEG